MYTPRRRAKKAKEAGPFRRIRLFIALCLVVFAGLGFGYIFAAYQSLPTVSNSMRPAVSSQVFDAHGRLITTLHSDQNRLPIDINKVPQICRMPLSQPKTTGFINTSASIPSASSAPCSPT